MFTRLRELNNEFKNIKEQKEKKNKKMNKTIIKMQVVIFLSYYFCRQ